MKKQIDVFDYARDILKQLEKGMLITAGYGDRVNPMSIAWGGLGIEWNKSIFIAYVREYRFTRELLDKNPEFTVNIPYGEYDKHIISYCGTHSGRDVDKIKELGLTLVQSDIVSIPSIAELPLTLECKIIYSKLQDRNNIPNDIKERCYPPNLDSSYSGSNKDYHIAYYGEIVGAYVL